MRHRRFKQFIGDDEAIRESHVVIVGLGTTGCTAAELVTRAGVDTVTLLDHDVVERSNLDRQVLFTEQDVGRSKVDAAREALRTIDTSVTVKSNRVHVCSDTVDHLAGDIVLDCTDNLLTRFVINDYCMREDTPWVYSAAAGGEGMVYVTDGTPCFNCVFNHVQHGATCNERGVVNTVGTATASVQVTQVYQCLLGKACDDIITIDVWNARNERLAVSSRSDCDACNGTYTYLNPDRDYVLRYCAGEHAITARPTRTISLDLEEIMDVCDVRERRDYVARIVVDGEEIVVYDMGEVVFTSAKKDRAARITEELYTYRD